jgi:hypothetical protein
LKQKLEALEDTEEKKEDTAEEVNFLKEKLFEA